MIFSSNKLRLFLFFLLFFTSITYTRCTNTWQNYCTNYQPLCSSFDFQVHGGICPIVWHKERPVKTFFGGPVTGSVLQLFNGLTFHDFFKLPLVVGAQLGYAMHANFRLYIEANYYHARSKTADTFTSLTTPALNFNLTFKSYQMIDGYIGVRYYWPRFYDSVSFFLGPKLGIMHRRGLKGDLILLTDPGFNFTDIQLLKPNSFVSGGVDMGLDMCFCDNWSLVLTGAFIITNGPHEDGIFFREFLFDQFISLSLGTTTIEVKFPITLGLRYRF